MALRKQSLGSANAASKNNTETVVFAKRVSESIQHVSNGLSTSHAGALIQVWMPETFPDGRILLQTEGLPFAITGVGDLLALFRCISCKYHFESDPKASESMGAIGRVYYSGKPELCLDIPQYDKTTYLRIKEAQLCRIHSTLIMPVFKSEELGRSAIAVVEISHDDKAVEFNNVFQLFKDSLKMVDLYTADSGLDDWNLGLRQWPMDAFSNPLIGFQQSERHYPLEQEISRKHSLAKAMQTGFGDVSDLLMTVGMDSLTAGSLDWGQEVPEGCSDSPNEGGKVPSEDPLVRSLSDRGSSNDTALISGTAHEEETQHGGCKAQLATAAQILAQGGFEESEPNPEFTGNEDITMKDEAEEDDQSTGVIEQANCDQQGKKNENRLAGGAGRRLSYKDLERHFSFGLKDAANRLGICPTTLKRACRRNGINRWPSRQISKLAKVWKQMGYGGKPPAWLLQNAISGNLRSDNLAYILNTGLHVGSHLPSQNSLSTTTTTSTAPFQGLDQTQDNDFKNRTHHGAYTAALQGNESLVFEDNSVTTNHCNHTWHGGDLLDTNLHTSVFPTQPLNPYLTTTASLAFSNGHVNLSGLSSEGRIAGHDSMSNCVSYDLEKTQRSGMALVLSELAIMDQDDDLLQQQLNGPLAFENTRHLF